MDVVWIVDEPPDAVLAWLRGHVAALEAHGVHGTVATPGTPIAEQGFDVAVATSATAAETAFRLHARRRAWLVWDVDDRRRPPGSPERAAARLALDLPLSFIAATPAAAEHLATLRADAPRHEVRLGVDKEAFRANGRVDRDDAPLRVLPADERAGQAVALAVEPHTAATSYADADVLLALEPTADPRGPLPAFHAGATCVAAEVGVTAALVRHGVDGLLCEPDDERGPARQLDVLARDRALLRRLREGALRTAAEWPSVEDAAAQLAAALRAIAGAEPPDPAPAMARLLGDVRGVLEEYRGVLEQRDALARRLEPVERIARRPAVARLLALGRRLRRDGG